MKMLFSSKEGSKTLEQTR